jgi:hypothetical protein
VFVASAALRKYARREVVARRQARTGRQVLWGARSRRSDSDARSLRLLGVEHRRVELAAEILDAFRELWLARSRPTPRRLVTGPPAHALNAAYRRLNARRHETREADGCSNTFGAASRAAAVRTARRRAGQTLAFRTLDARVSSFTLIETLDAEWVPAAGRFAWSRFRPATEHDRTRCISSCCHS